VAWRLLTSAVFIGATLAPVSTRGWSVDGARNGLRSLASRIIFGESLDSADGSRSHTSFVGDAAGRGHTAHVANPMSKVDLSCPGSWAEPDPCYPPSAAGSEAEPPLRVLRPTGRQLVALLGNHEVLTSDLLVRLTGLPERTVQHHLGLLYRAGLTNRVRPPREGGTSPYHYRLTAFGAAAFGAEKPGARSDDLAGVQATAALSELWLLVAVAAWTAFGSQIWAVCLREQASGIGAWEVSCRAGGRGQPGAGWRGGVLGRSPLNVLGRSPFAVSWRGGGCTPRRLLGSRRRDGDLARWRSLRGLLGWSG